MGANSKIEWCRHSFSPWEGCERVSRACAHCYAAERDKHWHGGRHWGIASERLLHTDAYWRQPIRWNREALAAGERHRVFCASLSDVFEDRRDLDQERCRLFALIEQTPSLTWMLLTKRPENIVRMIADVDAVLSGIRNDGERDRVAVRHEAESGFRSLLSPDVAPRPLERVRRLWLGVTFDDKGPERLDALAQIALKSFL